MIGTTHKSLERLIEIRSKGNPVLATSTRTRLVLKGFDPAKFTTNTPDDPDVLKKIQQLAAEWGIQL